MADSLRRRRELNPRSGFCSSRLAVSGSPATFVSGRFVQIRAGRCARVRARCCQIVVTLRPRSRPPEDSDCARWLRNRAMLHWRFARRNADIVSSIGTDAGGLLSRQEWPRASRCVHRCCPSCRRPSRNRQRDRPERPQHERSTFGVPTLVATSRITYDAGGVQSRRGRYRRTRTSIRTISSASSPGAARGLLKTTYSLATKVDR